MGTTTRSGIRCGIVAFAALLALGGCTDRSPIRPAPSQRVQGSVLLRVYLIGSSNCGACMSAETSRAFQALDAQVRRVAPPQGYQVVTSGIALDWTAKDGEAFLRHAGPFDDVAYGSNWDNGYAALLGARVGHRITAVPTVVFARQGAEPSSPQEVLGVVEGTDGIKGALQDSVVARWIGKSWEPKAPS
jgi:hypothetical protein